MSAARPPPPPAQPLARKTILSASAEGAKFLILLQISSRLLTFLVNQLLLRYLSPELLGISVQLELLTISILYFSRESLRNALQRRPPSSSRGPSLPGTTTVMEGTKAGESQTVVNLSLLTVPLGICFALALANGYLKSASDDVRRQPHFETSVALYVLATLLELAAEPGFAIAQQRMHYKLRAGAESAAAFTRCVLTCAVTVYYAQGPGIGPLPFAVGQLGYGAVLLAVYSASLWVSADEDGYSVFLRSVRGLRPDNYILTYFNTSLTALAMTMWIQSSIKHVLTQGDSLLVAWLTTTHDQGVYALASNYGSLAARMLFQPLEEISRSLFSKLLAPTAVTATTLAHATNILRMLLKLYFLLSVFAVALGPPFAGPALQLVAGTRWASSDAADVLAAYCYYIPLLALNGVTESFVQSVATTSQLHRQSVWMGLFSAAFAAAGYGFVRALGWGALGLVAANAVNMLCRIVWSVVFIAAYCDEMNGRVARAQPVRVRWAQTMPSSLLTAAAVAVAAVARKVVGSGIGALQELAVGAGLGVVLLAVCAFAERRFFAECNRTFRDRKV